METEQALGPDAPATAAAGREAIAVLIIDDEPHVRAFLRTALRSLGVTEIHEAANGEEGVARFAEARPALVLLDVNMPVLSGHAALREILALEPEAAVLVVTAENQHETVKQFRALGAMGYVLKQLSAAALRQSLAEALDCFVVE